MPIGFQIPNLLNRQRLWIAKVDFGTPSLPLTVVIQNDFLGSIEVVYDSSPGLYVINSGLSEFVTDRTVIFASTGRINSAAEAAVCSCFVGSSGQISLRMLDSTNSDANPTSAGPWAFMIITYDE